MSAEVIAFLGRSGRRAWLLIGVAGLLVLIAGLAIVFVLPAGAGHRRDGL